MISRILNHYFPIDDTLAMLAWELTNRSDKFDMEAPQPGFALTLVPFGAIERLFQVRLNITRDSFVEVTTIAQQDGIPLNWREQRMLRNAIWRWVEIEIYISPEINSTEPWHLNLVQYNKS